MFFFEILCNNNLNFTEDNDIYAMTIIHVGFQYESVCRDRILDVCPNITISNITNIIISELT